MITHLRTVCAGTLAIVALACGPATAQEAVLEEFYGTGVHHYFSGDYSQAIADLTAAIDGGSQDPRAYYFRGLARMRSGGDVAADFQKGAAMETADVNQYYPIGRSLERVQGATRMTIERYRAVARATALSRQQRRDSERYDQLRQRETHVLRAPVAAPPSPASAVESLPAAPQQAPKAAVAQPAPAKPAEATTPVPEPPAAEDPFADDAAKAPTAAEPAAPAEAPKAEAPAAPAEEEMPADEAPAEKKAPPAAAEGDDPFADPPAKAEGGEKKEEAPAPEPPVPEPPMAEPPAAEEPAPAAKEPAAAQEKPAAPKAQEEDPFAEAEPK